MQALTSVEIFNIIGAILSMLFIAWSVPQAVGFKPFCIDMNKDLDEVEEKKQ